MTQVILCANHKFNTSDKQFNGKLYFVHCESEPLTHTFHTDGKLSHSHVMITDIVIMDNATTDTPRGKSVNESRTQVCAIDRKHHGGQYTCDAFYIYTSRGVCVRVCERAWH